LKQVLSKRHGSLGSEAGRQAAAADAAADAARELGVAVSTQFTRDDLKKILEAGKATLTPEQMEQVIRATENTKEGPEKNLYEEVFGLKPDTVKEPKD